MDHHISGQVHKKLSGAPHVVQKTVTYSSKCSYMQNNDSYFEKHLNGKNQHLRNFDLAPALENAPPTHNLRCHDTDNSTKKTSVYA